MVLRQGLSLSLLGTAIGLGLSFWTAGLMRGILHGVTPADPATFAAVAAVLLTIALVTSVIPALRAARIDPVVAFKAE